MSKDPLFEHLRKQAWRRKLSPEEEAQLGEWLVAHPEAREAWEADVGLNEALGRLGAVPVPSNFPPRVLGAVGVVTATAERRDRRHVWFEHHWFRWAAACLIIVVAMIAGY